MSEQMELVKRLADVIGPMLVPVSGGNAGLVGRATQKKALGIASRVVACIHGEGLSFYRQSDGAPLLAAIQTHHDTKHGRAGGRSAAVLVAGDRALYEAAGIKHAVLGFDEGALDEVRRAPAPVDDGCCHKTRLADAPCPIGRECPFITKETSDV